ncbi:hypothetical protein PPYR_14276 [Photinus pyralis]|uniref:Glucosidase II subunit alpha n=1 Tax=Photinus pyralis TaxID=7054 RepID=A0A1Y1LFQ8_PHOPY|nr:neutral alpha-glucosidase AB [Photinus pyralis]KAB0792317.1 hypothetical protein PPYR_14276 [Photinus pyralis]
MDTSVRLLILSTLIACGFAVDRNNFKTCEQSSFCRRLRATKPSDTKYELNLSSLQISDNAIESELVDKEADVSLKFAITALADSTFRVFVDEIKPLHPRYQVEGVLNGEPQVARLELLQRTNEEISIRSGDNKVVIKALPFKIEFYSGGKLVTVFNGRGLFNFEHLRAKPAEEGAAADLGDEAPKESIDPGAWSENFKSFHDSKPRGPEAIGLDITFPEAQRAYGLPEHADRLALRTTTSGGQEPYRLYNLDVFEYELDSTMAIYGAIPMLYAHSAQHTVGVFWQNAAEMWVDVTNSKDGNVVSSIVSLVSGQKQDVHIDTHFMSESGVVDLFVFLGPTMRNVAQQYAKITGTAPLPQYFSLGYHQSRWNYNDEDDVRMVVQKLDEHNFPVDVMWLDIEYTDGKKYFTWDAIKFKNPETMLQNLTATGRKLVVIIDPHIKREGGYFLHEDALANNYYVKNKDGNVYEGWCWPGSSSYLDFFDPKVREYYAGLYAFDKFVGTTKDAYLWNDMNEPSVFNGPEITMPKDCIHYGDWEHRHVHNLYGLYHTMATFDGLLKRSGNKLRPFILTRGHFAGSQRYAAVWTGDNAAEWSHLMYSIPMCLTEALGGMSFCGADVGGFFKNPDEELLQRWFQTGVWLPFFRMHSHIETKRREPYLYSTDVQNRIRTAMWQRYAHLPVWYTLFHEHEVTGEPVIRPLVYHYPTDGNVFDIDNQLLVGSSIMARPVTESGASSATVYFPGGAQERWYDIEDFKPFQGSGSVTIPVSLDKSPVYYKGGSIIPRKDRPRRASTLTHDDPFTLYVALDHNNSAQGRLYIDDNESYEYRKKKYLYLQFNYKDGVLSNSFVDPDASYQTSAWIERVVILGPPAGVKRAKLESKELGVQKLSVSYDSEGGSLTIRKPAVIISDIFTITLEE